MLARSRQPPQGGTGECFTIWDGVLTCIQVLDIVGGQKISLTRVQGGNTC